MIRGPWALGPALPAVRPRIAAATASPGAPRTRRNPLRRQPPAYSPVPVAGLARGLSVTMAGRDPRPALVRRLARDYGAVSVSLWSDGTSALRLAIAAALSETRSTRVALPAYTCFSVAAAGVGAGAALTLYDVDPADLGPDLDALRRVLAGGVRIVVIAPLFGLPVDWDALVPLLEEHGALAIEDAAQGHGATWRDRPLGSFGRFSVLSFGRGKGWTGGSGGALLRRGGGAGDSTPRGVAGVRAEARVLAATAAQWALGRPALYGIPSRIPALGLGRTRYRDPRPPRPMSRSAAALLEAARDAAGAEAAARRANAGFFSCRLPVARGFRSPRVDTRAAPGFLRFPVLAPRGGRGRVLRGESTALGMASGYPSTLASLRPVRARLVEGGDWPGARELARRLITLPTHSRLIPRERERILEILLNHD